MAGPPVILYPSIAFLNSLYQSLSSTLYAVSNTTQGSIQSFIIYFLNNDNAANYVNMVNAINFWINSTSIPQIAVGMATGQPAVTAIPGLRIQVIEADGTTAFDSNSKERNIFTNIGIPASDFMTSGKYLINENQGSRTFFQAAMLSPSGSFSLKKYSNSVTSQQLYLCLRQGISPNEPFGAIVISMNSVLD